MEVGNVFSGKLVKYTYKWNRSIRWYNVREKELLDIRLNVKSEWRESSIVCSVRRWIKYQRYLKIK